MLTLLKIKNWIKSFEFKADNYYIGKLDNKKDKSIGVYTLKESRAPYIALGGLKNTSYKTKAISILIHWNKSINETEIASNMIYSALEEKTDIMIDDVKIKYIELLVNEPVDVGTDDNGIYEMVIQAVFYYEREREV